MQILRATLQDLQEASKLFDLYRQFYHQPPNASEALAFVRERLEQKDSVLFLAKDQGCGIGFTQLFPSFSSVAMKRIWILNDLYVHHEHRRKGIAQALMKKAQQLAQDSGAARLELKTHEKNHEAQQLYRKLGYRQVQDFWCFSWSTQG